MPLLPFFQADFFDRIESLDSALDLADTHFRNASSLNTSLSSFLMWQNQYTYAWAVKNRTQFILAYYHKYVYFPAPPKPLSSEAIGWAFEYMKQINGPGTGVSRIEGFTEPSLKNIPHYPSRSTITEYLYERSHVASLQGDSFRSQRASMNHLLRNEKVLFRPYRSSDMKACGELFDRWKSQRLRTLENPQGEKMILSAQKAHFQTLLHGEKWGISAWVVFLGNRLSAYTAGVPLSQDTFGVLLEVTDLTIKGLSAYIFSTLCRQLDGFDYVNTGDAEGLPRLAESKEHWHPYKKIALFALDPI